ncbi:MAG: hypothetical protein DHS20C18_33440 [Saprospiraceae bacterium]|nr:MAG: hypothetical protein DHS20C18_33440 [Saprospiraceae bacterium]
MLEKSSVLKEASLFVQQYLVNHLPIDRLYHNFDHAEEVVEICKSLAKDAGLSTEESEILQLAAWFHDCGYAEKPASISEGSVRVARKFLKGKNYPEDKIERITQLIQSIHDNKPPSGNLESILHDANQSFTGRKRFFRRGKLMRLEREAVEDKKYTLHEWNEYLLELLINQRFYTPWAQEEFSTRLNKNIAEQRENISKAFKKTTRKKTGKEFGRAIDTLYRVTLRNHTNLSTIADGKANMIISINTLVLSILITAGAAGFSFDWMSIESNLFFAAPILMLMVTSLTTIIFAVLSAVPKVSGEDYDKKDVKEGKVSMLFFSNFLKLEKPDFVQHLRELKTDQELLYDELSRDLYNLGAVLKKKYRLLTIAYFVFVGGLVLSFLLFLGSRFV